MLPCQVCREAANHVVNYTSSSRRYQGLVSLEGPSHEHKANSSTPQKFSNTHHRRPARKVAPPAAAQQPGPRNTAPPTESDTSFGEEEPLPTKENVAAVQAMRAMEAAMADDEAYMAHYGGANEHAACDAAAMRFLQELEQNADVQMLDTLGEMDMTLLTTVTRT